jgi:predicted ATP-grasp superfamily ATP-dependent carboligase
MRSIFIYEFITGGGYWSLGSEPAAGSLLAEGLAMRDALANDFAALADVEAVHLLHDARLPQPAIPKQRLHLVHHAEQEQGTLTKLARSGIATILIAPEFSSLLLSRAERCVVEGGQLLSPSVECIRLCSDKQLTCDHLNRHGVATPRGISFSSPPQDVDPNLFPAVLKPIAGAGSQNVRLVDRPADLATIDFASESRWRLERFHPGLPVSASLLTRSSGVVLLPPCTQNLSADGRFSYLGGSTPLPRALAERAKCLALATAETLPDPCGYLGIDIVLGSAENGSEDVVIEVNPRLTTSYLGLRQACEQNLADAMWRQALGQHVGLTFRRAPIQFTV